MLHSMQTRAAARKAESKLRAPFGEAGNPGAPPAKRRRALGDLPNNTQAAGRGRAPDMKPKAEAGASTNPKLLKNITDENAPNVRAGKTRVLTTQPLREITSSQSHNVSAVEVKVECVSEEVSSGNIELPKGVNDIDNLHSDPQMCAMYAAEIFQYIQMSELKKRYSTDYMQHVQTDINAGMRGILIDWLVEVAEEYKLVPDTLYLTVSYVDQYLSTNRVTRQRLQLLGVSCMLIASKYEEICAPQVEEFCYITDNTYTKEEVLEMERQVLKHLGFDLAVPTTKTFLRRFIRASQGEAKRSLPFEFLANYLAELTLLSYDFLKYNPSMIAASSVFIARMTFEPPRSPWTQTLRHYSGYLPSQLETCVRALHELHSQKSSLAGVREKYKQQKFKSVATLVLPQLLQSHFDDSQLPS